MKFKWIDVESVDIVEISVWLIVEVLEPIVVDKVDNPSCVKKKLAEIIAPLKL